MSSFFQLVSCKVLLGGHLVAAAGPAALPGAGVGMPSTGPGQRPPQPRGVPGRGPRAPVHGRGEARAGASRAAALQAGFFRCVRRVWSWTASAASARLGPRRWGRQGLGPAPELRIHAWCSAWNRLPLGPVAAPPSLGMFCSGSGTGPFLR